MLKPQVKIFVTVMNLRNYFFIGVLLSCAACVPTAPMQGQLGYSDYRRVVIVGENVRPEIALYYEKKYTALVWFTPYEGTVANAANNLMESGIGPSRAMRALMNELQSINYTVGRWEIIVPKIAEKYFLNTLKNMGAGAFSKARGAVVLIDSKGFTEVEREVLRVADGNFFVAYEFQKD